MSSSTVRAMALVIAAGLAVAPAVACSASTAAELGRQVALDACSACHQIGPGDPAPGPVYDPDQRAVIRAPAFPSIARDWRKDDIYLRAVIRLPHPPMKEQAIGEEDLAAIIAYIDSLRPVPHGGNRRRNF
jgi:mono/diheme cytochrome c family protein